MKSAPWLALAGNSGSRVAALLLSGVLAAQKPALPAPAPKDAARLVPVMEPVRGPLERRDLLQRFRPRHPIEGFYRLSGMQGGRGGMVANPQGCLYVGRRHIVLMLYAPGPHRGQAHVQSALRTYRIEGDQLRMSSRVGFRNDRSGALSFETEGMRHRIGFRLFGSKLRLMRSATEYLEFQRVE